MSSIDFSLVVIYIQLNISSEATYQLAKMWLLFPGRHPSLISWIDILLVSGLARVALLGPAGGLVGRGGVVTHWVAPHHLAAPHPNTLQTRVSLALSNLQPLYFFLLLFLLLRLSVSNKSHAGWLD